MKASNVKIALVASTVAMMPYMAVAQQAAQPAQSQLPEVQVIQKKQKAAPAKQAAPKAAPKKKTVVAAPPPPPPPPAPVAPPVEEFDAVDDAPAVENPNPIYGAAASGGAASRAANGVQTPINPTSIIPSDLSNFPASANNVTPETITERQPRTINEVFSRVPGAIVVNDDGGANHGGIGIRGSQPRRSRKILVLEDGQPLNLALWLDPSIHYTVPLDRIESVEILKGTIITHGPNNNFGVVNYRNLSPFGPAETVVSAAIGFTETDNGFFIDEDGERSDKSDDDDLSAKWHVHTRQNSGNVGVVASYTGENVQGAWDNERLRFNDFYGAIGWKGVDQDLTISSTYARQRDDYDEANLISESDEPGAVEAAFFDAKHCKTCFAPGSVFDRYYGEIYRGQITHNAYLNDDVTVTTRLYAGRHARDRYQIVTLEDDPRDAENPGVSPAFGDEDEETGLSDILLGEDGMFGRIRTFRHAGAETRGEVANLPLFHGMSHALQAGIRYEHQEMRNRNILGDSGQVLREGDETGFTIFERNLRADTVSAFLQSSVAVTSDFKVVPGVRFEYFKVRRENLVTSEEEGEAEEEDDAEECAEALGEGVDECLEIEGINRNPFNDDTETFRALPGVAFAYNGLYKTTLFAGYHQGLTTNVLRNEDFPSPDEIGDNFEVGLRTTALRGVYFEAAGFYKYFTNYQFGSSFSTAGDRSFGRADEAEISGVELAARVDSHPIVGGPLNVFGEATYTYSRAKILEGFTEVEAEDEDDPPVRVDLAGNDLPEVPFHVAALTLGISGTTGWKWDVSATYTYRGEFFTDELNTEFGGDPEGENGEVPDVWLLSARANLAIGDTGASVFIAGDNLTDKLYITDREDGIKPGIGRTIWTGFKYKF